MGDNGENGVPELFKELTVDEIMGLVDRTVSWIRERKGFDTIIVDLMDRGIPRDGAHVVHDIGITRDKAVSKFPHLDRPFFTAEGLRWATPQMAADHCAERLSRDLVLDVTCGQGGQVLSLARTCERVVAIDLDPLNCLLTRMNLGSLGIENVEVINADCLSDLASSRAENGCAVFSDPSRPAGVPERKMDDILPDPRTVKEKYDPVAEGFCFEVPPYLSLDKVPFDCEAEYLSVDGRVNRLNLYVGDLKENDRSAVILPGGDRIKGAPLGRKHAATDIVDHQVMNEVDPSLVKADLVELFISDQGQVVERLDLDERRTMLISNEPIISPFIKDSFEVLGSAVDLEGVKRLLAESDARSVTLRFPVEPSEYWKVRNELEKDLSGSIKTQLFKGKDHILTFKVTTRR